MHRRAVAGRWNPLRLQAAKKPLHPVSSQPLSKQTAGRLAALIRMEQHVLWFATLFVGHV